MAKKVRKESKVLGPIFVMGIITIIVMLISFVLSLFGIEGQVVDTTKNTLEMKMVGINNIFSAEGIKFLFSSNIANFNLLTPIAVLVISLISTSIAETSGLIKHISLPLKKLSTPVLIFITLLVSSILTFLGEYSFAILLPVIGIIFKYTGRNPMLGIITAFIGITCSYGTGMIYNYDTYFLGTITELSATMEVDPSFTYDVLSCCYIMIVSTFIIVFLGTGIINKYLAPKFKKVVQEEDELKLSNKALWITNAIVGVVLLLTIIMILPGGILLDNEQTKYIAKLMSPTAPFREGIMIIILLTIMITSAVYGKISGNIQNRIEYNVGLYKTFQNVGYVFVLMFFASIMISILNWTNVGVIISSFIIRLVSQTNVSGTILIALFFISNILISIFIPSSTTKWNMMAPLIVPLFMRSNITPEFTQFIFSISDGIGKAISPFFIFFVVMLGFLQKYNDNNDKEITIFGTIQLMLPSILLLAIIWLVLIICWNIIGLPLGIDTFATM